MGIVYKDNITNQKNNDIIIIIIIAEIITRTRTLATIIKGTQ
jgi:hypothetical protein